MTVTKAGLFDAVYRNIEGISKQEAQELVEIILEIIKETLEEGEDVKIAGFGKFQLRDKHPRKGRNPQTGEEITITSRRVLTFKPSPVLKAAINDAEEEPEED